MSRTDDRDEHVVAPPVFGEESQPSTVWLPTEPVSRGDQEARIELRHTEEGALALLMYTSTESLTECCGDQQPWVAIRNEELQQVAGQVGAEVILQDFALPESERREGN